MKISIGIPVYNAENYLEAAIQSILSQSFIDWELIIVDDGSTDNSLEIAKKYECANIHVYSDGINRKLPYRLNQITSLAKYDLVARMDADDIVMPERLKKQIDFLNKNKDIDLVSTGLVTINNENKVLGYRFTPSDYVPTVMDVITGRAGIIHASILARKEWFLRNPYDEKNVQAEDYQLWIDAFLKDDLKVGFIEEPLYCYREDLNVNLNKMLRGYTQQIFVLRSLHKKGHLSFMQLHKSIFKLSIKKIIVRFLFSVKKESVLLEKRLHHKDNMMFFQEKIDKIKKY